MYIFKAKQNNCVHLTHGLKHSDTHMLHELHTAAYYCVGPRSIQGSHAHNSLQRASGITSITLPGYPETCEGFLSLTLHRFAFVLFVNVANALPLFIK